MHSVQQEGDNMTNKDFMELKAKTDALTDALLNLKGAEYDAATDDRLHSFKTAGAFTGNTSKQVLGGYLLKHITSVYDMIRDDVRDYAKWDEKILDIMSYMYLLRAINKEEEAKYEKD